MAADYLASREVAQPESIEKRPEFAPLETFRFMPCSPGDIPTRRKSRLVDTARNG